MKTKGFSWRALGWASGFVLISAVLLSTVACNMPRPAVARRGDADTPKRPTGPNRLNTRPALVPEWHVKSSPIHLQVWQEKTFAPVSAAIPKIPGAELVNDDELCMNCHEAYAKYHKTNVHRKQSCEACHGPGSQHIRTRGKEPGLIYSFKTLKPAERSELCMKCHEKDGCAPGLKWRTSSHAHSNVSCTDCHKSHYNVPPGTPSTKVGLSPLPDRPLQLVNAQEKKPVDPKKDEAEMAALRAESRALLARNPETCYRCHQGHQEMSQPGSAHQIGGPKGLTCTSCHDAHSNVKREMRADQCLQCHQGHPQQWATSTHAQKGVACADCHNPHANRVAIREAAAAKCATCHQTHAAMYQSDHPHQIGGPKGFKCTTCHDAHGNVKKEQRTEQCLQCHKGHPQWASSKHAENGVACADCHNPHDATPAIKSADPKTCFACHQKHSELERVAHPHQICGAVGMKCATCHDPHGNILPETRADLCLKCHKGHPTQAWTSSIHAQYGVACVDCHNPHPNTEVPGFVDIQHTHVTRPKRMPMSVEQPFACYQCHAKIAALFELPSHHPVREGKMNCSSCHDSHGMHQHNLREPTVNLTCYRCHAEKSGPFVWSHPPVTENCDICHNPHGAVAKNLLLQPPTFLCLRCHSGHRRSARHADIDAFQPFRPAFYTDCSQCHQQVHGSNLPAIDRRGPRLTR